MIFIYDYRIRIKYLYQQMISQFTKYYIKISHVLGHCLILEFLEASRLRYEAGHISKQGSFRALSSSGAGGCTPNLNCHTKTLVNCFSFYFAQLRHQQMDKTFNHEIKFSCQEVSMKVDPAVQIQGYLTAIISEVWFHH